MTVSLRDGVERCENTELQVAKRRKIKSINKVSAIQLFGYSSAESIANLASALVGSFQVAVSLSEGSIIVDANVWPPPSISCAFVKDRTSKVKQGSRLYRFPYCMY